jgi:hypothetical protein
MLNYQTGESALFGTSSTTLDKSSAACQSVVNCEVSPRERHPHSGSPDLLHHN